MKTTGVGPNRSARAVLGWAVVIAAVIWTLILGAAMPGHVIASLWVSTQRDVRAIGPVIPRCYVIARRYQRDPNYPVPPKCLDSKYFRDLPAPPNGNPPPPDELPPSGPDAPAPVAP
jgi:hypothetical protein